MHLLEKFKINYAPSNYMENRFYIIYKDKENRFYSMYRDKEIDSIASTMIGKSILEKDGDKSVRKTVSFTLLKPILSRFLVLGTTQQSNLISFIANTTIVSHSRVYQFSQDSSAR